ncbi:ADP-ribosylglycohydrolase family protein [Thermodesulfobacteriota bacterium]
MMGAIAGDIIGSVFEHRPVKTTQFPLFTEHSTFTDDTVLTVAVARAVLTGGDYASCLRSFARRYPDAGYGFSFFMWMQSDRGGPYNSWGNGSAMRVSPVGFAFESTDGVLEEAEKSAAVTHNHPEGIKGAQATALAVHLAAAGTEKAGIKEEIISRFGYDLDRALEAIRPWYRFDVSCQGSVPEAIIAFLESESFADCIRKAVSLGGDSDTLACIAGGIAHAYYGEVPGHIVSAVRQRIPGEFLTIVDAFQDRFSW